MEKSKERIELLVKTLNVASDKYYNTDKPMMEDAEYDRLYDELSVLERDTGYILSNSPTSQVGYIVKSKLEKVEHIVPLKSLGKTKDVEDLKKFLGTKEGLLMLKADGLTNALDFDEGELERGTTRGNGFIGEDITHSVKMYKNIPLKIKTDERIRIIGEALIKQGDFERVNDRIILEEDKYKNPRNLVSGTIRNLDNGVTKNRSVRFYAFDCDSRLGATTMEGKLSAIASLGIPVVPHKVVKAEDLDMVIEVMREYAKMYGFGIDGLVLTYNDLDERDSKGETSHHPQHSIAFKFEDETEETILKDIEWQVGRTGVLTPVAIFDTVELDGTEVSRASLHNVSQIKRLGLGLGDSILVYKANQIIPQVLESLTKADNLMLPTHCPSCGELLTLKDDGEAEFLYCNNSGCFEQVKQQLVHYCSRDAMNINGLNDKTIETFMKVGLLDDRLDIYDLPWSGLTITSIDGMGEKKFKSIVDGIEKSKNCKLENFIFALGIPGVGKSTAKDLAKFFNSNIEAFLDSSIRELKLLDGISDLTARYIHDFICDNYGLVWRLSENLNIEQPKEKGVALDGLTFVVTGSVEEFKNRNELEAYIESNGGKPGKSVSKKTSYLICNQEEDSSKYKKAKDLGVPIITEKDLLDMVKVG